MNAVDNVVLPDARDGVPSGDTLPLVLGGAVAPTKAL